MLQTNSRFRDTLEAASALLPRREARTRRTFEERMVSQHPPLDGGDGYLFHQDHDVIEQLGGRIRFNRRQLKVWRDTLCKRRDWCAARGIVTRTVVIPEKHVVYADLLPERVRISPVRPLMQIFAAVAREPSHGLLYPQDALRRARERRPAFYRTDTHWTQYGAYAAYRWLMESLAPAIEVPVLDEAELAYQSRDMIGDLGVRYLEERGETAEVLTAPHNPPTFFANNRFERGAVHVYETPGSTLPTCVIFRDSFSNFLLTYLTHSFSRIVAVSSVSAYYDLLERERPDVALFVTIERFLATFWQGQSLDLPTDLLEESFEAFTQTRFEQLRPAVA